MIVSGVLFATIFTLFVVPVFYGAFARRSHSAGSVDRAIARLQQSGHVYEKDGALWFRSTDYGDEKDRVIVRDNGQKT